MCPHVSRCRRAADEDGRNDFSVVIIHSWCAQFLLAGCLPSLSIKTRLIGFCTCFVVGMSISMLVRRTGCHQTFSSGRLRIDVCLCGIPVAFAFHSLRTRARPPPARLVGDTQHHDAGHVRHTIHDREHPLTDVHRVPCRTQAAVQEHVPPETNCRVSRIYRGFDRHSCRRHIHGLHHGDAAHDSHSILRAGVVHAVVYPVCARHGAECAARVLPKGRRIRLLPSGAASATASDENADALCAA